MRALLVTLGMLAMCASSGRDPALAEAELLLKQGKPGQALVLLDRLVDQRPSDQRVVFSRALAQARVGRCDQALPALLLQVDRRPLTPAALTTIARCYMLRGELNNAIALAQLVVQGDPGNGDGWVLLVRTHGLAGDLDAAQAALIGLIGADFGEHAEVSMQAELAFRQRDGDPDGWLAQRLAEPGWEASAGHLDAWRWLDLGDPRAALEAAGAAARHSGPNPALAIARAEALRRLGDPDGALQILEGPIVGRHARSGSTMSILARVWVDLGRQDDAERLMAQHPTPWDRGALETEWYLTHRTGQSGAAASAAIHWRRLAIPPEASLTHLVPL